LLSKLERAIIGWQRINFNNMKRILFLILSLISITVFAQQSDTLYSYTNIGGRAVKKDKAVNVYKVYKKDSVSWVKTTSDHNLILLKKETFSDPELKVLNGNYSEYSNGKVSLNGTYTKGSKNGRWIKYNDTGNAIESETYNLNQLQGPFTSYWPNGKVMEEGNYTNGKLEGDWKLYTETGDLKSTTSFKDGNVVLPDGQIKLVDLTPPQFPGGMAKFYHYIGNSLRYPKEALDAHITGKVFFVVTVNKEGTLKDFTVISSPHDSLTQAAKSVILGSPKWIPGTEAGKPVDMKQTLNINFSLN
jgi:TonB family protein